MVVTRALFLAFAGEFVTSGASRDWLVPFDRLQVSSSMIVTVITDPSRTKPDLDVAADAIGLGWTVQSEVQPMTFGSTLLLGMDSRAARQNFHWPAGGQVATLTVPAPLTGVAVTGGCQVTVDTVTGDLSADGGSNLTVQKFASAGNSSHIFLAAGANITIRSGVIGHAFVQALQGANVDLAGSDDVAVLKVDSSSSVLINSPPALKPAVAVAADSTATNATVANSTNTTSTNATAVNVTRNVTDAKAEALHHLPAVGVVLP